MENNQPIDELKTIRHLMERSSKFLLLNGLSLILPGMVALIGAAVGYFILFKQGCMVYDEHLRALGTGSTIGIRLQVLLTASLVLILAISSTYFTLLKKAKRAHILLWTSAAKRTLLHFLIPLTTGGLFCMALIINNNIHLVASAMLIFYGLALINAGKFTIREIHSLGLCQILLGLIAGFCLNYGLLFWTIGFGLLHIVFGIIIYFKYDRKPANTLKQ